VELKAQTVHRGRVELVDESAHPASGRTPPRVQLRQNLADPACLALFAGACIAQIADAVTTVIGLDRGGHFEANGLMRYAVTAPLTFGFLKVALVVLLSMLAMLRLPTRRARVALLLAMSLGLTAPIQNVFQILSPR
jgi:uncharacterized membrane protein